jgi:shikimate kinase
MPGCGKTTVSKAVAAALGLPWFDSDAEIEAAEGARITEIFARRGEEYFREVETACIRRLMSHAGAGMRADSDMCADSDASMGASADANAGANANMGAGANTGVVIAVGGGAVLRNAMLLRKNATVVYLKRSVELIRATLALRHAGENTGNGGGNDGEGGNDGKSGSGGENDGGGTRPLLRDSESLTRLYRERRALYEAACDFAVTNETSVANAVTEVLRRIRPER